MSIDIGAHGVWQRVGDVSPETAVEIEGLGFGALWVGGSPPGDLVVVESILEATRALPVATGIVNMWRDDATTLARSYHRINDRYPNRLLVGVGIGHPESTSEYRDPLETIISYLDTLDAAGVPREHMCLAALGPRALEISSVRTAGAHPYLTTKRHTSIAREVMGPSVLLAPEQTVIVGDDDTESRQRARTFVARYLRLGNYRRNLLREGWSEDDLAGGGSDRLLSELVLMGSAEDVANGIEGHIGAGADHVCIQEIGNDPIGSLRQLAEVLLS